MAFDMNALASGAIGSICGGIIALVVAIVTQNRNWKRQDEKVEKKKDTEEGQLFEKFFMELNYNKRKTIYTIENESYKLTGLDNFHWKNFVYSKASYVLMKDKELIDELAVLDSMIDQINDRIRTRDELEKSFMLTSEVRLDKERKRAMESIREYASKEIKPQIDKAIAKLEKIFSS